MKQIFKLTLILFVFVAFASCQNDEFVNEQKEQDEKSVIPESDVNFIKSLGFDETSVVDRGDDYLVEGDILIDKPKSNYPTTRQKNYIYSYKYTNPENLRDIKVYIEPSNKKSSIEPYVIDAINQWNYALLVGTNIKFRYVTTAPYDIIFEFAGASMSSYMENYNNMYYSFVPGEDGKVGNKVQFSLIPCNPSASGATPSQVLFQTVHALGHCIGLSHTDANPNQYGQDINYPLVYREGGENEFPLENIPDTPTSDLLSVMNYNQGVWRNWDGFSPYDKHAVRIMYPGLRGMINASNTLKVGRQVALYHFPYNVNPATSNLNSISWTPLTNNIEVIGSVDSTSLTFNCIDSGVLRIFVQAEFHTWNQYAGYTMTDTMTYIAQILP